MDELEPKVKVDFAIKLIVYLIGMVGNILVIFVILYLKEYKKITHWYVLQLAVADLIFLQAIPFRLSEMVNRAWTLPVWLCKAKQSVLYINYYGSIIFLTLMALDRYLAVCHGLSKFSQRIRAARPCYLITVCAWIVAVLMCIPVMMFADTAGTDPSCICTVAFPLDQDLRCKRHCKGMGDGMEVCMNDCFEERKDEKNCKIESKDYGSGVQPSDYMDYLTDTDDIEPASTSESHFICMFNDEYIGPNAFILFNFIVMFLIPLITITFCYTLIIVRLKKTSTNSRRSSEHNDSCYSGTETNRRTPTATGKSKRRKSSSGGGKKQKTRVTVMCAVLVMLFATCWLPYHVVQMAKRQGLHVSKTVCEDLDTVTLILLYLNSALNPYLYNFLGTFRKRMRQIRKHKRTRALMSSIRMTRMGRRTNSFVSSSESGKTKRTIVVNDGKRITCQPKEEIPLTLMNTDGDRPSSSTMPN